MEPICRTGGAIAWAILSHIALARRWTTHCSILSECTGGCAAVPQLPVIQSEVALLIAFYLTIPANGRAGAGLPTATPAGFDLTGTGTAIVVVRVAIIALLTQLDRTVAAHAASLTGNHCGANAITLRSVEILAF